MSEKPAEPKSMAELLPPELRPDPSRPKMTAEEYERSDAEATCQILRQQRIDRFTGFCPARFREKIDRALIPNLAGWDEADKWTGTFPGPWLWSPGTGRAKTRMLWRQFGRLHVDQGRGITKMSGQGMAEEYFRCHMDGEPSEFYRGLGRHEVVMLDDLDKIDFSNERTTRMLREAFDKFYESNKPVLVTSNKPIAWFVQRIGESACRRMREVCREIEF